VAYRIEIGKSYQFHAIIYEKSNSLFSKLCYNTSQMSANSDISEADLTATADDRFDQPNRRGRPGRLPPDHSAIITRRITALAVSLGLVMAVGKFWLWGETGSVGVLASLVHSALDMFGALRHNRYCCRELHALRLGRFTGRRPDGTLAFIYGLSNWTFGLGTTHGPRTQPG